MSGEYMRKMIIQSKTQAAWRKKSQKLPTGVKPMTIRLPVQML